MARTSDAKLRDQILDVALTLLRVRGEQGVTMRAVAEGAGTTTPTLYSRFPDRESLLLALALRERDRYAERQSTRRSLEDAARGYLDWAVKHPHEYRLIYGMLWPRIFSDETGQPGLRWTEQQLAARFGGHPREYESVTSALWLLLHGAASMLTQNTNGNSSMLLREKCLGACDQIIQAAGQLRLGRRDSANPPRKRLTD